MFLYGEVAILSCYQGTPLECPNWGEGRAGTIVRGGG